MSDFVGRAWRDGVVQLSRPATPAPANDDNVEIPLRAWDRLTAADRAAIVTAANRQERPALAGKAPAPLLR